MMIVKCKRCGEFLVDGEKMCGKCGWTNRASFYDKDSVTHVRMGKARGTLRRYVIRNEKVVKLIPARTHRQRRKFVADKEYRKVKEG